MTSAIEFRWNDWNIDHATRLVGEIESVVRRAKRHEVRKAGHGKWRVEGRGTGDRMIEVVFLRGRDGRAYVIHAMPR